jgi:ribosome hibernation promoting factor
MRLSLTGRHVEVTPALRQLVTRRLVKIERVLNDSALSASVVLVLEKRVHSVEITLHARGDNMLTGKGSGSSFVQAIGPAVEKVMQQVAKVKEKWIARKRRIPGGKGLVDGRVTALAAPSASGANATPTVEVRRTRYAVKPMSIEDAALRIEAVSEPFVVFRHAETERINILYQRPDGRLGLIDPEL